MFGVEILNRSYMLYHEIKIMVINKMSKIEKLMKKALDKSIGDTESLAFFKKARDLPLSAYVDVEDKSSKTFTYSSSSKDVFENLCPISRLSNSLNLSLEYSISGLVSSPTLEIIVVGDSSDIKPFDRKFTSIIKNKGAFNKAEFEEYMKQHSGNEEEEVKKKFSFKKLIWNILGKILNADIIGFSLVCLILYGTYKVCILFLSLFIAIFNWIF